MARFVFHLEGVLRHRTVLEEQRQRDVAAAKLVVEDLQARLRAIDAETSQTLQELRQNHLIGPIDLTYLAAHRRYTLARRQQAIELVRQMSAATQNLDSARRRLLEAAKERKTLERLRDRRRGRFDADQARIENAAMDEVGMRVGRDYQAQDG